MKYGLKSFVQRVKLAPFLKDEVGEGSSWWICLAVWIPSSGPPSRRSEGAPAYRVWNDQLLESGPKHLMGKIVRQ